MENRYPWRWWIVGLAGVALLASAGSAGAGSLACSGVLVNWIEVRPGSDLIMAQLEGPWGKEIFQICHLDTAAGTVSPTHCKAIHTTLIIAMLTERTVTVTTGDNANVPPGPATCEGWLNFGQGWPRLFEPLIALRLE